MEKTLVTKSFALLEINGLQKQIKHLSQWLFTKESLSVKSKHFQIILKVVPGNILKSQNGTGILKDGR